MHIIVCLDDRNGISFNGRRLSSDRAICQRIIDTAVGNIWMDNRSANLFAGYPVQVDEDFLNKAERSDTCFVESLVFLSYLSRVSSLTIYRWNRLYPSDVKLPHELFTNWRCIFKQDFPGNSHELITEERYIR